MSSKENSIFKVFKENNYVAIDNKIKPLGSDK